MKIICYQSSNLHFTHIDIFAYQPALYKVFCGLCTQQALLISCVQQNSGLGTLAHPSSAAVACLRLYNIVEVVFIYNLKKAGTNVIIANNREAIQRGCGNELKLKSAVAGKVGQLGDDARAATFGCVGLSVGCSRGAGRGRRPRSASARPGRPDKSKFECSSRVQQRAAPHLPLSSPDWQAGGRASDDAEPRELHKSIEILFCSVSGSERGAPFFTTPTTTLVCSRSCSRLASATAGKCCRRGENTFAHTLTLVCH
jgi:hypothetical protein